MFNNSQCDSKPLQLFSLIRLDTGVSIVKYAVKMITGSISKNGDHSSPVEPLPPLWIMFLHSWMHIHIGQSSSSQ